MSISKMSEILNGDRYFNIEADSYDGGCLKGVVYHGGTAPGIRFDGLMEMAYFMNCIYDGMGYAKQTTNPRNFAAQCHKDMKEAKVPEYRKGRLASFQVLVKYRCHASWQGELLWKDERLGFDSYLSLMLLLDRLLTGGTAKEVQGKGLHTCQIAVDSCTGKSFAGRVMNASVNYTQHFAGSLELARAMENVVAPSAPDPTGGKGRKRRKLVRNKTWNAYQKGGAKASFLVRVLFQEHGTWQGIIYWREGGEPQRFRSFMELLMLLEAALSEIDGMNQYANRFPEESNAGYQKTDREEKVYERVEEEA